LVPVEHEDITSNGKSDGIKFQVVSYNILAQSLTTSRIFPHSPSPCLRKETRMPVILDVLKNLNADILCLQKWEQTRRMRDLLQAQQIRVGHEGQN
nr:DNAse I-like superfamily protein [Tanacetum cinerariifolium]